MYTFLIAESDSTCKRNAFVFLAHCSMPKAVEYILSIYETIPALDEGLQMSIIEIIRLDCKNDSAHRVSAFLRGTLHAHNACSSQDTFAASLSYLTLPRTPSNMKLPPPSPLLPKIRRLSKPPHPASSPWSSRSQITMSSLSCWTDWTPFVRSMGMFLMALSWTSFKS